MKKLALDEFYTTFNVGDIISREALKEYIEKYYGPLRETTLVWRIYDLINTGYIRRITTSNFEILNYKKYRDFKLDVPDELLKELRKYNENMLEVKKRFLDESVNISVWNTSVLNQYTTHQVYKNIFIIEIDKMRIDNLYYHLQHTTNDLVLKKNSFDMNYLLKDGALYLSNLPKKSPIQRKQSTQLNFVSFPKVEKILVDVFIYNKKILPYDLSEIENIYRNMYKRHIIKTKTVLHYAGLRGPRLKEKVVNMLDIIGELPND